LANRFAGLVSWRENLAAERDRWPLWLPVALGIGAGGYFALPVEPSLAVAWVALGLALAAAVLSALGRARWLLALLAALLLGFGLAKLRESRVETPVLDRVVITHLTARIVSLEPCGPALYSQRRGGCVWRRARIPASVPAIGSARY
jgi:hypothetical protein